MEGKFFQSPSQSRRKEPGTKNRSAGVRPETSRSSTSVTRILIPRTQGRPPHCPGFVVMRLKRSARSAAYHVAPFSATGFSKGTRCQRPLVAARLPRAVSISTVQLTRTVAAFPRMPIFRRASTVAPGLPQADVHQFDRTDSNRLTVHYLTL